jgi:hypothetical protein
MFCLLPGARCSFRCSDLFSMTPQRSSHILAPSFCQTMLSTHSSRVYCKLVLLGPWEVLCLFPSSLLVLVSMWTGSCESDPPGCCCNHSQQLSETQLTVCCLKLEA